MGLKDVSLMKRQIFHKTLVKMLWCIPIIITLNVYYKAWNPEIKFPRVYYDVIAEGMVEKKTYTANQKFLYIKGKRQWVTDDVYHQYEVGQNIQLIDNYKTVDGWDLLQMIIAFVMSAGGAIGITYLLGTGVQNYFKWVKGEI